MNIYGGLDFGVASPIAYSGNSVGGKSSSNNKEIDTSPSSGMSGTAHYEPASSDGKKSSSGGVSISLPSFDDNGTPHWEEHKVEPEKAEPATVDIALPGFDDNGTPHWEEHKVSTEGAEPVPEKHLDVGKLLEGTHNEGYKLYSDGEGGFTQDPNSKGGIYYGENALAPKSTAPRRTKQTSTAALPEVSQIYNLKGDDYDVNSAFAAAQMNTGDNQVAASISGSRGGGSNNNSNVNDAIFGGQSNRATPGYSLW